MATKIQEIKATNWQLSNQNLGEMAEGIEDIKQCIDIILTTQKGSDPLRPLFGSDIWKFIDNPTTIAAPNISAEIIDAIGKWEQRILIKRLVYNIDKEDINFELIYELQESGETTEIIFTISADKKLKKRNFSAGFSLGFN